MTCWQHAITPQHLDDLGLSERQHPPIPGPPRGVQSGLWATLRTTRSPLSTGMTMVATSRLGGVERSGTTRIRRYREAGKRTATVQPMRSCPRS